MGDIKNECKVLVGNPEWKRSLGRHRRRREDNIRMNLGETGREVRGLDLSGSG
jgi:hypothetical protein